jgi:hypothetical protein
MKAPRLARAFLWVLASLAVLAAFVFLDWYPTVKELSRLRRERGDLSMKTKNYAAMTAGFTFPDREEKSLLAQERKKLRRALPAVDDDDAWPAIVLLELQSRVTADRVAHARVLFTPQVQGTDIGTSFPGKQDPLADWIFSDRIFDVGEGFWLANNPDNYLWRGVIPGLGSARGKRPASRGLGVALAAPLPVLLNFINHLSWGNARMEIVRLHLEPGLPLSRAWLVCRGNYVVHQPSRWEVKAGPGGEGGGNSLLVDPDSPLLWQRIDPGLAYRVKKKELPPASGGNRE